MALHYYVTYNSMMVYNQHLRPTMSTFRVFALSNEFKLLPVRQEEKLELAKLLERVPIPVKESFVLVADMVFVQQSAGRILRAMFEICLKRGWAVPAKAALDLCKMVEKRISRAYQPMSFAKRKASNSHGIGTLICPLEIGELIGMANAGRLVHRLVHNFPKLQLSAQVQPSPALYSASTFPLSIPDFQWDEKVHGGAESFLILVEDVDVGLIIADEVQLVGGEVGPTYEVVISRTRYVSAQTESKTRIVACGVSLANAKDLGEWMGAPSHTIFNFSPRYRTSARHGYPPSVTIPHFPLLMIASTPAYLAIVEHAPTKPVVIFVPSRKQCRLTADNLMIHCTADDKPDRFLNVELADIQPHLDHLCDEGLKETLSKGIAYFHEAMDRQDKRIVQRLFESGAVQVLIASKDTAWSLPTRKDYYKKFLAEGLPIEIHLPTDLLHDYFLAEIAVKTIENKQDTMDTLTWTYFYRRMTQNPNYYNLHDVSHQHLSDHLSELVENTLTDLVNSKCISIEDDMDISALNLGMIAAYYTISYVTVEVYTLSLKERTKLKGLLEVVSSSAEFEVVPIRRHEDVILRRLYDRLPVKIDEVNFEAPHFKTFLLLQAHFSRIQLPADLILEKVLNLLSACVDMCVQAVWDKDSPLRQIPHFEPEVIKRCTAAGIESMSTAQMQDVAAFVNSYPTLGVSHELVKDEYTAGPPIILQVSLSRDVDEDDEEGDQNVVAPYYPAKRWPTGG
ncbi:Sec63-domain-containing protein [Hymenopellis radicata]|nr:Sec63-domain-containing protein [Hymenopellis radicata]